MKFTKARKGYNTEEVDAFVKSAGETAINQKEYIAELKGKLSVFEAEVNSYRHKQELIAKSIMNAIQKAEQIENTTKQKYIAEMEHLKAFHERWLGYYNKLIKKYPLNDELNALSQFNKSMSNILAADGDSSKKVGEVEALFEKESARLLAQTAEDAEPARYYDDKKAARLYGREADDKDAEFNPEDSIRKLFRRQVAEEGERKLRIKIESAKAADEQAKTKAEAKADAKAVKETKCAKPKDNGDDERQKLEALLKRLPPLTVPPPAPATAQWSEVDDGFSYEECLNPTQELSDILRDLGLEISLD